VNREFYHYVLVLLKMTDDDSNVRD